MLKEKTEASLCTLYWYFKIIPFTIYIYVLANILQNGAKFIQKTVSKFKKSHEEFGQLQEKQQKVLKVEI